MIESLVDELINEGVFTDPVTDIFKTASYGLKKIGAVTGANLSNIFGQLYTTMIPWVSFKESQRIEKETNAAKKKMISQLDSQYKDVLDRNYSALSNRDISALAMLLKPGAYLTSKVGLAGASGALAVLSLLSAPFPGAVEKINGVRERIDKLNQTSLGWQGKGSGGGSSGFGGSGYGDFGDFGSLDAGLYESKILQERSNIDLLIRDLLHDPEVVNAIKNSNLVKELDRVDLNAIKTRISELENVKTIEQFEKLISPEEFVEFKNKILNMIPKKLKDKNIDPNNMLPQIKDLYKASYIEILNKKLPNSSIPDEVKDLIQKLK